MQTIESYAHQNQCAIIENSTGIALIQRFFDDDGTRIIRFQPDPCDFHSEKEWADAIRTGTAVRWIC